MDGDFSSPVLICFVIEMSYLRIYHRNCVNLQQKSKPWEHAVILATAVDIINKTNYLH